MVESEQPRRSEQNTGPSPGWERELVQKLVFAALTEQRRARRWNIFFKVLFFLYLTVLLVLYLPLDWESTRFGEAEHTALVEITGKIASDESAKADSIVSGLRAAFKDKHTKGVILRINSPGGSPVQAGYVYDEIQRLRQEYPKIKLYAVITDIGASGGYYIAAAADEIYADPASIVGSIGVLMNGFGFVETLDKLGIERRLLTAGKSKGFLDPFSPLERSDVEHIKAMLEDIHQQFIERVKKGRGDRLTDDSQLFSGLVWTGKQALELGLVDALGSSSYVAREVIKAENIVDFTYHEDYLERLTSRLGLVTVKSLLDELGLGQQGLQ